MLAIIPNKDTAVCLQSQAPGTVAAAVDQHQDSCVAISKNKRGQGAPLAHKGETLKNTRAQTAHASIIIHS